VSTPFEPQPCCNGGGDIPDPLNVVVTNEPLDVNVLGTVAVTEPVTVDGTVSVNEPVDVNVLGTVPISGTVSVVEPVDVNLVSPDPVNVNVTNVVDIAQPVDVNVVNSVQLVEPVTVDGTVGVSGTVAATVGGSTAATNTLTAVTTGTGATVDFLNAKSNVTMMIRVNGTATGGIIAFEASHDSTNWVVLSSSAAFATGVNQYLSFTGGAFRWFRGRITTNVAGGGNITVTLMFA